MPDELLPLPTNWYDYLSVHQEMLEDNDRLCFFYDGLKEKLLPGQTVLDIGTGTGILAIMAAKLGAERVYAIDKSKIIEIAKAIAIKNKVFHKIQFIRSDSFNARLPEKVDLIVSEMIGHCGFEEHCLTIFEDAQKRFLKKNGIIIPSELNLYAVPIFSQKLKGQKNYYNQKLFGIDMSLVFEKSIENIFVEEIDEESFLANPQKVVSFKFFLPYEKQFSFSQKFPLFETGELNGVALWFETKLGNSLKLNSGPFGSNSHWKTSVLYFKDSLRFDHGDSLEFNLKAQNFQDASTWQWSGCVVSSDKDRIPIFSPVYSHFKENRA